MKRRGLGVVLLMITAGIVIPLLGVGSVHAVGPLIVQQGEDNALATTVSFNFTNAMQVGNSIVIECMDFNAGALLPTLSASSSHTGVFTSDANANAINSGVSYEVIYLMHASVTAANGKKVTCTASGGNSNGLYIFAYEVQGDISFVGSASLSCSSGCSPVTNWATTTTVTPSTNNDFEIGGYFFAGGSTITWTAGIGYTIIQSSHFNCILTQFCVESSNTISSATNFPMTSTGNGNPVAYVGLGGIYTAATIVLVIPCTWFQQQCWWYPSLFFGLYLGLFAVVARKAEIEGRALTYMMLSGLNMSAIAQTAMGLLTPVLPLLLITLTVVYVVRFRNR